MISLAGAKKLPAEIVAVGGVKKSGKRKFVVVVAVAHKTDRAVASRRGPGTPNNVRLKLRASIAKKARVVTKMKQVRDITENESTCKKRLAKTPKPNARWLTKSKLSGQSPRGTLKEADSCSLSDGLKKGLGVGADTKADPPTPAPVPMPPPPSTPPPKPKTSCSATLKTFVPGLLLRPVGDEEDDEDELDGQCDPVEPCDDCEKDDSLSGPTTPLAASRFELVLPGGRQVTNWLDPAGFTCLPATRVTTNDTLSCTGTLRAKQPFKLNVRYSGGQAPSAELYVIVNGKRQGPFSISRAAPAP